MNDRRDRHGRGVRGPLMPTKIPRYRRRPELFDAAVLEAYAPIQQQFAVELESLDIAVDTIPRMRLNMDWDSFPPEVVVDGPVPLGRIIQAGIDIHGYPTRARIVIFRMPIEQRVLTQLVAQYLGITPEDIDPHFRSY